MNHELIIFYDSTCPLCTGEMDKLKGFNQQQKLGFVSLQDSQALEAFPELNQKKAMTILQGQLKNGEYIQGLDVTHKAWSVVGKGHLTFILRLPILKFFFDKAYLAFASNRYRLSALLTGKKYNGSCDICVGPAQTQQLKNSDQAQK